MAGHRIQGISWVFLLQDSLVDGLEDVPVVALVVVREGAQADLYMHKKIEKQYKETFYFHKLQWIFFLD